MTKSEIRDNARIPLTKSEEKEGLLTVYKNLELSNIILNA